MDTYQIILQFFSHKKFNPLIHDGIQTKNKLDKKTF